MNALVGIDPGANGGMAVLNFDGTVAAVYAFNKLTVADMASTFQLWGGNIAWIEDVHASPQMGVKSAFSFGRSVGIVRALACAANMRVRLVRAATWQKEFKLLKRGRQLASNDTEKKNANKNAAQAMFADVKVTHAIADSLLIAEYGRRLELLS